MHKRRLNTASTVNGLKAVGVTAAAIASLASIPATADEIAGPASAVGAERCTALTGKTLGGATIDKAEYLKKGAPTISPLIKATADICRVSAKATPVAGSDIKMRIWLPSNWNGKMLGIGGAGLNGGFAAEWFIALGPMNQGYAAMATDAGHDASEGGEWALGQPEKLIDYGYRATHVGTLAAKAIIADYFGNSPRRAYFHGCSNGGRDALMMAQRFPQDYEGIVAGAPANYYTALMATFARNSQLTRTYPGSATAGTKLQLVHDAAMRKCDAADGVVDGLISNPSTCRFDPGVLQCKRDAVDSCLSAPEVSALRAIYEGVRTRDGKLIMPGFPPGSELEWRQLFSTADEKSAQMPRDVFRYMVYDDPNWNIQGFDLDREYGALQQKLSATVDATSADLRTFIQGGGKLLLYHGWEDTAIPAGSSIRYFDALRRAPGEQADDVRLFMVPGLGHCFGGSGPSGFDAVGALDQWMESGKAPERLVSTQYESFAAALTGNPTKVLKTRPICAWPKTPRYDGTGPVDQESSFSCK